MGVVAPDAGARGDVATGAGCDARGGVPALALLLSACGGTPPRASQPAPVVTSPRAPAPDATPPARRSPYAPAQEDPGKRGNYVAGGLYAPGVKDSAPPEIHDVHLIPEPEVRAEPRARYGNRDYTVLGKHYEVLDTPEGYVETGLASFYGNKFHGRRTSSLEVYDMYAFSAAHKTLPLPSFARVTNLSNGKSVIVRVNDRGPFHDGRVIDLSYAAAVAATIGAMTGADCATRMSGPRSLTVKARTSTRAVPARCTPSFTAAA